MATTRSDLAARFCAYAADRRLFSENESVLLGLSGGADSTVLLHLLLAARDTLGLGEVRALHVNHGLRGDAAARDEAFCRDLCKQWNVPFAAETVDVPAAVAETGESVEQAARRLRYAALFAHANGAAVVTAHTASDNAETVLLHLTRGSGLRGLCGILPRQNDLVRPLLFATRAEVEAYAAANGLSFVTDETNADTAYSRNRVRADVMPALKAVNPQVETALLRLCDSLREDEECLRDQGQLLLECAEFEDAPGTYDREVLKPAPPAILRRALLQMLPSTVDVEKAHVEALCDLVCEGGAVTLPGGVIVKTQGDAVFVAAKTEETEPFSFPVEIGVPFTIAGETYVLRLFSAAEFENCRKVYSLLLHSYGDYAKINGVLTVRSRLDGDTYRPVGRGTKTLKKLLNEAGLSAEERSELPLLCDENGIVAAFGFGFDERAKVTDQTENILVFTKAETLL